MKFPIGIQDFRVLREGGYVYVDKTEQLARLPNTGKYYFFARPRRFGKSLAVSTYNELFSGSRELFDGLWAAEHWDFEAQRRPVVWLQLASSNFMSIGLEAGLRLLLSQEAAKHGIVLPGDTIAEDFRYLLKTTHETTGQRVVLLVDEYDKPIVHYLDKPARAEANRDIFKSFYSVLKDADPYLDFVFMTGVSGLPSGAPDPIGSLKVSIFSDLNQVRNITLDPKAYTLTGITEAEIDRCFSVEIDAHGDSREHVRDWYNGYSWGGAERLYNPWSLMTYLDSGLISNYWFETGTPTWLVKQMSDVGMVDPTTKLWLAPQLMSFDLRELEPVPILFQTGYLTVDDYDREGAAYRLRYPNREVRLSFDLLIMREVIRVEPGDSMTRVLGLRDAFRQNDLPRVFAILNATLAEIPHPHWGKEGANTEYLFHATVWLMLRLVGVYIKAEVSTAKGRADAVVETATHLYAMEFKLDRSVAEALRQIEERGYPQPYADDARTQVAVGVKFSSETRQMEWEVG